MTAGVAITSHRTRFVRFEGLVEIGGWRIKRYGIATHRERVRPVLMAATMQRAAAVLPQPAVGAETYGAGFVIAHDAQAASIGLVYWWQSSNELHQRGFLGPLEPADGMAPIAQQAAGCVWELAIIAFERDAWLGDVLANPGGADLEAYLGRGFNGDV